MVSEDGTKESNPMIVMCNPTSNPFPVPSSLPVEVTLKLTKTHKVPKDTLRVTRVT